MTQPHGLSLEVLRMRDRFEGAGGASHSPSAAYGFIHQSHSKDATPVITFYDVSPFLPLVALVVLLVSLASAIGLCS